MNTAKITRNERLMPAGVPRYVRVYDDPYTGGRYTVVFTGRYQSKKERWARPAFIYLGMSEKPFHPQGFGQHGSSETLIDGAGGTHLGKRIKFADLPEDCQRCATNTYKSIWNI